MDIVIESIEKSCVPRSGVMAKVLFLYSSMRLLAGNELFLEWPRRDNFDPFYGGPNILLNGL